MGHYLPARYYGVKATLPYFIPFPLGPIGTMGAVIQIKDPIPNKRVLFDIGVGGPFISLILSIIAWFVGISISELVPLDKSMNLENYTIFGESIFTYYSNQLILGPFDPQLMDVNIHPLARAAWVGLLITAINLLPFGQLDGGHIIYAIFGEKYRNWIHWLFVAFLILAFIHFTWLIWAFLIYYFVKVEHPFISDYGNGIGTNRKIFGYVIFLSLIFIFVPRPIMIGNEINDPNMFQSIINYITNFTSEI
jgi:membrane-associated protease RseP (regulator of RpoE activity)